MRAKVANAGCGAGRSRGPSRTQPRRARLPRILAALCATGALLAATGFAPAPSGAPETEYYRTVVEFDDGSSLITRVDTGDVSMTPAHNGSSPSDAEQAAQSGSVTTTDGPSAESRTDTPQGYTLQGSRRTGDFVYKSDEGLATLDRCTNDGCTVKASVKVKLKQTLNGGSSHRWTLGLSTDHWSGDPYSFSYDYYCGVSVPNARDWTCDTNEAAADGHYADNPVRGSTRTYNYDLNRDFGARETARAKFPMVAYHISWPGYPATVHIKYRGWDIRYYSGVWKMAPLTGTGN